MNNLTIESAKQFLKDNGYFTENMWQISDVTDKYNCTKDEAMNVLNEVLNGDRIKQEINETIDLVCSLWDIPELEDESDLLEEFEDGAQNRFRNNDFRSFEEWKADKED